MGTAALGIALGALCCSSAPAFAQTGSDIFAGQTIRLIIGFDMAGTYGQYAQLAAQHLRRHLPGNPSVIAQ